MTDIDRGSKDPAECQRRGTAPIASYMPARDVRRRYRVSDMTLRRWLADEDLGFPKPYYFGRLRYWLERELIEWEVVQPRERATA